MSQGNHGTFPAKIFGSPRVRFLSCLKTRLNIKLGIAGASSIASRIAALSKAIDTSGTPLNVLMISS